MPTRRWLLQLGAFSPIVGCAAAEDPIATAMARIRPLFLRKLPLKPGDWLTQHKEPGQTYAQFREVVPRRAIDAYKTIRLVPIGPRPIY